jgi:phosphatidylinositol alpha-1,6-mannosyltransferase
VKHLLVTNDFPPKVGGIQNVLYEWWRRLPPENFAVLTSPYRGAQEFDAAQNFLIKRITEPVLLPHPLMVRRINQMAQEVGAELIVLDPAVPLGIVGPWLDLPYVVIVHGAEVTVPGRLPVTSYLLGNVLRKASGVIASGTYPAQESIRCACRDLDITVVTPGVDVSRFQVLSQQQISSARKQFGIADDAQLIVGVSRLVPRKGFDILIRAAAHLASDYPKLRVVIAGGGRDRNRLDKMIRELRAPVTMLGRVSDADLPNLYGCADICAMLCRSRWGGLEQEGFGIVFAEAAACGVPQIAGRSGGSADAVEDGVTGLIIDNPNRVSEVVAGIRRLLDDKSERQKMGYASRLRAKSLFDYDKLAVTLGRALKAL